MADLVFYTHPMSRGRTVRWMLEELGRPYRTELLEYGGSMKAPAYLAINPMGKVPALTHGEAVVTETTAICAYLADAFPEAGLAPAPGSPDRAPYYRWMLFASGPVEMAMINGAMGFEVPEGKERMAGYGTFGLCLDTLEAGVRGRTYVAGPAFSTADLVLASLLGFGMGFGMIEKRPAFEAYAMPLLARPAAIRARQIDDALLPDQAH